MDKKYSEAARAAAVDEKNLNRVAGGFTVEKYTTTESDPGIHDIGYIDGKGRPCSKIHIAVYPDPLREEE